MLATGIMAEKGAYAIPASGRNRQILVVEDNESVRDILSRTLSFWGYDVTPAGNGVEAGTLFLTGSYDLVITDLEMPLMNGWELARLIKKLSPNTPVMVVSGSCDETRWEMTKMCCVDAIIAKPFKLKEIGGTVRRLLNRGT
jgi:DNA-binding response OmpR family regulator